jgi:hypothetical protein
MDFDKIKKELQEHDQRTLTERAQRWQELSPIQADGRLFASQREWDYAGEASENYIAGNYRSTIFSCACAVEQILRFEYLKIPSHKYEDIDKCTFGEMIKKCSGGKVPSLNHYLKKADILNRVRNLVAAHPIFIDLPLILDVDLKIRKTLLIKDIDKLIGLVDELNPGMKKRIEDIKLTNEVEGRVYDFGQIIGGEEEPPYDLDGFWSLIEQDVLKFLANQSWTILKEIAEGLYGISS